MWIDWWGNYCHFPWSFKWHIMNYLGNLLVFFRQSSFICFIWMAPKYLRYFLNVSQFILGYSEYEPLTFYFHLFIYLFIAVSFQNIFLSSLLFRKLTLMILVMKNQMLLLISIQRKIKELMLLNHIHTKWTNSQNVFPH